VFLEWWSADRLVAAAAVGQLIILIAAACRAGRLDVPEPHREPIQVPPERLQPGT